MFCNIPSQRLALVVASAQRHSGVMPEITFQIRPVRSAADLVATVRLFNAYAFALGIDLSYQDFAAELATPPGKYGASAGELQTTRFPFQAC